MNEQIIKLGFNPKTSKISDILTHPKASALYCLYKRCHVISEDGNQYLNDVCREIIQKKMEFDENSARVFLKNFLISLAQIEHSMYQKEYDWINITTPFLTGQNTIKLEVKS